MITNQRNAWRSREARGISVIIVAVGMVFILGMAGLAIDLASFYVGRSQAQRAVDAAALAGAQAFVDKGCTSGVTQQSTCETLATQRAETIGNQNLIAGQSPNIKDSDITFDFSNTSDPRITVSASHMMPTFFAKIFGVNTAKISVVATAEAFNPSGSDIAVATACVKPWLLPNCDSNHYLSSSDPRANTTCQANSQGDFPAYYVYPPGSANEGQVVYPGKAADGGAMGTLLTIKPGDPHSAAAPSKYYTVYLPPGDQPSSCPACATGGGGGPNSGSLYRNNIECCNQSTVVCGADATVQPIDGNMVGPTQQGVDCLIHQGNGNSGGQDTFDPTTFTITAGSGYGGNVSAGTPVSTSDSIVNVPIYSGQTLCPGNSCPSSTQVAVVGLMQLFIKGETNPQGTVQAYIMNIGGCGSGNTTGGGNSGGGTGTIIGGGGSIIPVRLIRNGS